MSEAVQDLLNSFDRLPESERREALSEILKRSKDVDAMITVGDNSLSEEDEELIHLAEMTFLELDAREAADGKS
jgi:hypothetical protein